MENNQNIRKTISNYTYNLNDIIGSGYSSKVYKGINTNNNQIVAIKVISFEQLTTPISKSLLKNEINVLRQINHINLMRVYEIFESKNNTYLVCEFCNEGDLADILEKKNITEELALEILSQIVQGIKALHDKSKAIEIIHRDIKPANILKSNDVYKLADFGFAVIENQFESIIKKFNVGTPMYMAPETVQYNIYSEKSDIWALGIVLFQMIYNQLPFIPKNEFDLTKKHRILMNKIQIDKETTVKTKELIKNMLKYDADQRPSINDIISYLQPQKFSNISQDGQQINKQLDSGRIQEKQNLKQVIKSQPDEIIQKSQQFQMIRSQKLPTHENNEKEIKNEKIDQISQLKDIKQHILDQNENKKNIQTKKEQLNKLIQVQQTIQYNSPLRKTDNINKQNLDSQNIFKDEQSCRNLQVQKSLEFQDIQSMQSYNPLNLQKLKDKDKNSNIINIPQFGINKAIKILPKDNQLIQINKQIDESECILHSNQNSTNDTIKHNQISNCQQIQQEKNIHQDNNYNSNNKKNQISMNKSPVRVQSQQTINTQPFKLSGISMQRNSQEKQPNYYFQTKFTSPIVQYSSQTKPIQSFQQDIKIISDFSNIKLEEDNQFPVKIRPTYKFLQFLNQTIKLFETINTEEKQKCYFLLKKLLAIKAQYILNDCPQNKLDIIKGYIDSFIQYYQKIETLFYVSIDKQFELFFNKDLSQFNVQFSEILIKYIQQVNKILLKKELIELQDILIENLKQQNDPILFARRWENYKQ